MKRILIFMSFALFLSQAAFAQSEPKFIRDAAILNEDGTLSMIASEAASYHATGTVVAEGESAKVRIGRADKIKIVVKVKSTEESPMDVVKAFKMKVGKNGKRTAGLGAYGIKSKALVPFEYDTYGDHCFVLTFTALEPGEYGFWYAPDIMDYQLGDHQMTFFGIDNIE